jgi:hypothetical protein
MKILLDKEQLRRRALKNNGAAVRALEEELSRRCENVAADERFTLLRIPPDPGPAPAFERITRLATLRDNPVIAFAARAAGSRSLAVAVSVNGTPVATLEITGEIGQYSVRVPPEALVGVKPNTIRISSAEGGLFSLEDFWLFPLRDYRQRHQE